MSEVLYNGMVKVLEAVGYIPNREKALNLKDESFTQYKSRLFKRSGELYSMLHNRPKNDVPTMTKEEILAEMAKIQELKEQVFAVEKKRKNF